MFQAGNLSLVLEESVVFFLRRLELHILVLSDVGNAYPSTKVRKHLIVRGIDLARKLFDGGVLLVYRVLGLRSVSASYFGSDMSRITFFRSFFCLLIVSLA
jgi:hypothetical protein